jgi:hypothetical protein
MKGRPGPILRRIGFAAASVFIGCAFISLPSDSVSRGRAALESYSWEKEPAGQEIAVSRSTKSFNFIVLGDLSQYSLYLVKDVMHLLSSASGIALDRKTKYSTVILHDRNVFLRAKTDKKAFNEVGIDDELLAMVMSKVPDDAFCNFASLYQNDHDIVYSIVFLSQEHDSCLVRGLLASFGVHAEGLDFPSLLAVCALYDGRRLGVRSREALSREWPRLVQRCVANQGNAR